MSPSQRKTLRFRLKVRWQAPGAHATGTSWREERFETGAVVLVRTIDWRRCLSSKVLAHLDAAAASRSSRLHSEAIGRGADLKVLPASHAQESIWRIHQLDPGSATYNHGTALRLAGPLDVSALCRALTEIVRRHEVLRTTFTSVNAVPFQVVHPPAPVVCPVVPLVAVADPVETAASEARTFIASPFDLSTGPLLRCELIRVAPKEHVLALAFHQVVCDTWSVPVFLSEATALYAAYASGRPSPLPDLAIQYADYATAQRERRDDGALAAALAYWERQLWDVPALAMPTDYRQPDGASNRAGHVAVAVPAPVTAAVRRFSEQQEVTTFVTLLAAWQAVLARYTVQHEIAAGTSIPNRRAKEVEELIGPFENTLVLRTDLSGDPTGQDLVQRAQAEVLAACAHQEVPFERVMAEVQRRRGMPRAPLFQTFLQLKDTPEPGLELTGLEAEPLPIEVGTVKSDVELCLQESGATLTGSLAYRADLFMADTVSRLARHYTNLLEALVTAPHQRASALPLLGARERTRVVEEWNTTACQYDARPVHEQVAEQAKRRPAAVAVRAPDGDLTYAALLAQARHVARVLRAAGVRREVPVAVCLEPSLALAVAALAVWQAGGVYVPLEGSCPPARLASLIRDSGAALVVTSRALQATMEATAATVVAVDVETRRPNAATHVAERVCPQQLASIIYASESSGRPHGVAVTHDNLSQYLAWCRVAYSVELPVDALWQPSIGPDLSLTAMLTPLVTGGTVVVLSERAPGVRALHRALQETSRRVLVKVTPGQLEALERVVRPAEAARVAVLIVSGEPLPQDTVAWWRATAPASMVINEYGSAETSVGCCTYFVDARRPQRPGVPIGRPIFNTQLYVVECAGEPAPPSVPGKLYIGGAGVSRGYHRQPALTAERFVPDPFSGRAGARLYASGDMVRASADGTLEFAGGRDPKST